MLEVERDKTECLRRLREEEEADLSKGQSRKNKKRCQVSTQNKVTQLCVPIGLLFLSGRVFSILVIVGTSLTLRTLLVLLS